MNPAERAALENLARFLDSLSVISRRENLRLHDRSLLEQARRHAEAAEFDLANKFRKELMTEDTTD